MELPGSIPNCSRRTEAEKLEQEALISQLEIMRGQIDLILERLNKANAQTSNRVDQRSVCKAGDAYPVRFNPYSPDEPGPSDR